MTRRPPGDLETPSDKGRRSFLKNVGLAGVASAAAAGQPSKSTADHAHMERDIPGSGDSLSGYVFFNAQESRFVEAAVDTLIPADDVGPGALAAGVAIYIDRQMAGSYGAGARMYLQGPYADGTPQQGWQIAMTPSQAVRAGIEDCNRYALATRQAEFADLPPAERIVTMQEIEGGKPDGCTVPPRLFFNLLLDLTREGYFGDPVYGGNRGKAAWRMIGFPGVAGMYAMSIVEYRNKPYPVDPLSIQDFG